MFHPIEKRSLYVLTVKFERRLLSGHLEWKMQNICRESCCNKYNFLGSGSMKEEYAYDRDYEKHFDFLKKMFHMYPMIKDRLITEEIAIQQFKYYLQALILELKKLNFARYHM